MKLSPSHQLKDRLMGCQIWGGTLLFSSDETPQLLPALRDFTENYDDPKAGIILTAEKTIAGALDIWIMFLFYDGPTPPDNVFAKFQNITNQLDTCKTRTYLDLLTANNDIVLKGSIYTIANEMTTLPSAQNGAEVLGAMYDHWSNTTDSINEVSGLVGSIAFQPVPKRLAKEARDRGGDLIDLDPDVDRIIMEFDYSYWFATDDATVDDANIRLYSGMKDIVDRFVSNGKLPDAYRPLFMNDAYFRQDVNARYKNPNILRSAASMYDPKGLFADRTKGFPLE